ncbi:hypothetical protein O9G_003413 [Rozella allomycis CSF55]|uniref:GOLD domain-containing protein n=1 Tax=Rozella allomycis (strain CSF55) TaxID=988480 RepID=A0A075AUR2_ROZAC|nr:hypothetical protein O9G_003413 [Rozella allomycis CSF55]|eukprot:EPZ32269.1 hypothetical protein O9G_003413 [Rozella allomycis CSF55]
MAANNSKGDDVISPLEKSIKKLGKDLNTMLHMHKYFKAREHRNHQTVMSTESRVYWFAMMESIFIIVMAVIQVYLIKTFFATNAKGKV